MRQIFVVFPEEILVFFKLLSFSYRFTNLLPENESLSRSLQIISFHFPNPFLFLISLSSSLSTGFLSHVLMFLIFFLFISLIFVHIPFSFPFSFQYSLSFSFSFWRYHNLVEKNKCWERDYKKRKEKKNDQGIREKDKRKRKRTRKRTKENKRKRIQRINEFL